MSVFTNPASRSAEQAVAYTQALLELLGSQDPLHVLRTTADTLPGTIDGLSAAELARPERDGKWSVLEVLRHLADSEIVWAYRVRMILAHDRPPLTGYDQDAWAERLRYAHADARESLDEFRVLRRGNLRLLTAASPADLQRVGVHAERGEESVEHLLRLYAAHDLLHLRQIARIRDALSGA